MSIFVLRVTNVKPPPARSPWLKTPTAMEIGDVLRKAFPERFATCCVSIACAVEEGQTVLIEVVGDTE